LNDCVATGSLEIVADEVGALADFDCASSDTPHACRRIVPGPVAISTVGEPSGSSERATSSANSSPMTAARFDWTERCRERDPATANRILWTRSARSSSRHYSTTRIRPRRASFSIPCAAHFAPVLITDGSSLKGLIQCSGAADAFLDPTVIRSPGSSVTGCEHGSVR
jgi:hypothetical protein